MDRSLAERGVVARSIIPVSALPQGRHHATGMGNAPTWAGMIW